MAREFIELIISVFSLLLILSHQAMNMGSSASEAKQKIACSHLSLLFFHAEILVH